jgi:hypothetical protein
MHGPTVAGATFPNWGFCVYVQVCLQVRQRQPGLVHSCTWLHAGHNRLVSQLKPLCRQDLPAARRGRVHVRAGRGRRPVARAHARRPHAAHVRAARERGRAGADAAHPGRLPAALRAHPRLPAVRRDAPADAGGRAVGRRRRARPGRGPLPHARAPELGLGLGLGLGCSPNMPSSAVWARLPCTLAARLPTGLVRRPSDTCGPPERPVC